MRNTVLKSLDNLQSFCENEKFKGYDPYDGLTSSLFRSLPFISGNRIIKLAWIQFFKRSPLNFRRLVGIKKEYNPKALGLFLAGYCQLFHREAKKEHLEKINFFGDLLLSLANKNYQGECWGYNFDWQSRAFFQPKDTPTIVATTFISSALLDAFEITGNVQYFKSARSACDFILKDLNRSYDEKGNFSFSYSPLDKSIVFNASLLGSRILSRVYQFTNETNLKEEATKSVIFCCNNQRPDGSWGYGSLPFHQWVDNFHTGYNLECISDYMKYSGNYSFQGHLEKGFNYYINTFFTDEGIPRYYNNSTYPIDIHAPAQMIITLYKLGKLEEYRPLADKVLNWTIDHLQSEKGFFYYQINKYFSSKISYMRWAQAWMFYALTTYVNQTKPVVYENMV